MNTLNPAQLLEVVRRRYATKKFNPEAKIPDETWAALEASLVLSPSSYGLQPWKFFVVKNPEVRTRLKEAGYGQGQITDASHLVIFAVKKTLNDEHIDHLVDLAAAARGTTAPALKVFRDMVGGAVARHAAAGAVEHWSSRQVYIALGQFMTSAALLGLDTCPMEGIDADRFDEILGLKPLGYATLCACPVGYHAADDKYAALPKVRFAASEVITHI